MRLPRSAPMLLALTILLLFLFIASRSTLWDRDEPRFARATVEMVQSGDYLVPTFNGDLRPDKPILIYWLMSVPVRLLGQTELACRFFAPAGVMATCLLVFWAGVMLFDRRTAFLAMGITALNPLMLMCGTAATTDAVLLAFITGSVALFLHGVLNRFSWLHALGLGILLGLAQLTKGPVGLAIPVLTMVTFLGLEHRRRERAQPIPWSKLGMAVVLSLLLFLAWGLPANLATGGELARMGIGHHVMERSVSSLEGHGGRFFLFLPYYIPVVLVGFFPWVLFLPAGLGALVSGRLKPGPARSVLIAWTFPTFMLMTVVITKLPHYVLPIWPALALITAAMIEKAESGTEARDSVWLLRGRYLYLVMAVTSVVVSLAAPWFVPMGRLRAPLLSMGVLFLALTCAVYREYMAGRYRSSALVLMVGMLLFGVVLAASVLPNLERFKVSPVIAAAINEQAPQGVPVWMRKYKEPSLIFYLDRGVVQSLRSDQETVDWARKKAPGVLVITEKAYKRVKNRLLNANLTVIKRARGFNVSKGRWVEVIALLRGSKPS